MRLAVVPTGLAVFAGRLPGAEAPGYSQSSLRDFPGYFSCGTRGRAGRRAAKYVLWLVFFVEGFRKTKSGEDGIVEALAMEIGYGLNECQDQRMGVAFGGGELRLE
jgi:hypothetical protein